MANMAAKVLLQPIRSDTAPQNKRPSALKMLTRPKSGAIAAAETLVRSVRMNTAFEMMVMPPMTLTNSCSHNR